MLAEAENLKEEVQGPAGKDRGHDLARESYLVQGIGRGTHGLLGKE